MKLIPPLRIITIGAFLTGAVGLFGPVTIGAQSASNISWASEPDIVFQEAMQADTPVLLFVTGGIWCDPCRWFEENTLSDPSLVALVRGGWIALRLEDTDPATLRWDRTILPTLILLDPEGNEIDRIEGTATADTVQRRIVAAATALSNRDGSAAATTTDGGSTLTPTRSDDLRNAVFRMGTGTIWNDGGAIWYTQDIGLPLQLEEYDRDSAFLYLRDTGSATVLAITVADDASARRLWRWDRAESGWSEIGPLERID